MSAMSERRVLLDVTEHLSPATREDYPLHSFHVPEHASKVGLVMAYHNEFTAVNPRKEVLFISLHDPDGFRGNRMSPGGRGDVQLELWVSPDQSSEGAVPGPLPAGEWLAQVDVRALDGETDYHILAYAEFAEVQAPTVSLFPADHVVRARAGWYKGELHAHSNESDGKYPVETVVKAAQDYGLDFLSLTDHTTNSQWHKLAPLTNEKTALIRSLEITSHIGHANLHGLSEWVNVYIDKPDWSVNQAIDQVHRQSGLFCVNHAYSGNLSWRDFSLDWDLVDLMEIYHNLEGANNDYQVSLWDHHLASGRRIVGVGGTDSHNPFEDLDEYGQVVTWVYADELSEKGIISGLKQGLVYVSRGPQVRFTAHSNSGQEAMMWETLPLADAPFSFQIEVLWDQPLRLFVIRDGLIFKIINVEGGTSDWQKVNFSVDQLDKESYFRIELHDVASVPPYKGILWRNYSTVRVLTNPIWVG
jgi:hypothetical protein